MYTHRVNILKLIAAVTYYDGDLESILGSVRGRGARRDLPRTRIYPNQSCYNEHVSTLAVINSHGPTRTAMSLTSQLYRLSSVNRMYNFADSEETSSRTGHWSFKSRNTSRSCDANRKVCSPMVLLRLRSSFLSLIN